MKTYLNNCRRYENQTFFIKTSDLKFTQQKLELKNQTNKRFIKLFTNVEYANPWLHGTHQNGFPFLAKLEQADRGRWFLRPQLSESSDHPLTLKEEERTPSLLHSPREKSHTALGLEILGANAGARNHHLRHVRSICYAEERSDTVLH